MMQKMFNVKIYIYFVYSSVSKDFLSENKSINFSRLSQPSLSLSFRLIYRLVKGALFLSFSERSLAAIRRDAGGERAP